MVKAIGIDLGTTNTVAAEVQHGHTTATTILNHDGKSITRSSVGYENGTWKVGAEVEEMGRYAPNSMIASTKRFIGLNYDEERIQRDIADLNRSPARPRVVPPPSGDAGVIFRFYPEGSQPLELSPIEVATLILRQVKKDAEEATGSVVTHAVITVPAYFDAARKEATRQAGEAAGLQVQRIISEPLAAALAYGFRLDVPTAETVLIFDMGGGTLDVTVCTIGKEDCVELAVDGNNHLGGDDLDARLARLTLQKLRDASGVDFEASESSNSALIQTLIYELRLECRTKKELLSSAIEATISDKPWSRHPNYGSPGAEPVKVTRAEFEAAIADLVDEAMQLTQRALDKAGCTPTDIDKVLLVGGSTFVPVIRERLRAIFGSEKVRLEVNPMEVVAQGAALLAAMLPNLVLCPQCRTDQPAEAGHCARCGTSLIVGGSVALPAYSGRRIGLIGRTARTISVKTVQGNLVPFFKGGTQFSPTESNSPEQQTGRFRVATIMGSRSIRVEFYEGEGERADDPENAFYAEFTVTGLPADTLQGEEVMLDATLNGDGSLAGDFIFRARKYPYVASPSRWRGILIDKIEEANRLLPNIAESPARAQLQQAIEHAEAVAINRASDARAGRAALKALEDAIKEAFQLPPSAGSPEMEKLSLSLAIGGAMLEYGGEWVNLVPMVTASTLRDTLLGESQLLSALRPAIVEGRQIEARSETALAERAADRIDSILHASDLLYPLVFARIISEYSNESGRKRGPGGLFSQMEWEQVFHHAMGAPRLREAPAAGGTKQQCARDISALLEQMRASIVVSADLFHFQLQRVMSLMDQFYSAQE